MRISFPACAVLVALFSPWASGQTLVSPPPAPPAPKPPQPVATQPVTPASVPGKPPAPPIPPVPEDYFVRYGKILVPGTELTHPLKLALPFPDVGEVKIPTADELAMREKLENLAILSDADIRAQLEQWPPYGKMSLADDGLMLTRIQQFRERRSQIAAKARDDLGLSTLNDAQKARFEKEYWDKRLQMERELAKQFQPILDARRQKMKEELFREFSSSTSGPGPIAPAPKPPPAPVAQAKPSPPPAAPTTTTSSPVGQGPMH